MSGHARAFREAAQVGVCGGCGQPGYPLDPHHVLPKRFLRGLPESVRYDKRNVLGLHRHCHELHTTRAQRLPRSVVPESAWEFARELGDPYLFYLEQEYADVP